MLKSYDLPKSAPSKQVHVVICDSCKVNTVVALSRVQLQEGLDDFQWVTDNDKHYCDRCKKEQIKKLHKPIWFMGRPYLQHCSHCQKITGTWPCDAIKSIND